MDTLYKWRVQEKDRRGRVRWHMIRSPMTEETARFWAMNNGRIIERVDMDVSPRKRGPATVASTQHAGKSR